MTGPVFKPRDLVATPGGRLAKVREILPGHERRVEFLDRDGGEAHFKTSQLNMIAPGIVRPWPSRIL